jgi:hypothetical protein
MGRKLEGAKEAREPYKKASMVTRVGRKGGDRGT